MHEDVLQQVGWAAERGLIDRDRVAILGGSYGGNEVLVGAHTCGPGRRSTSQARRRIPC
ncbi:MAG: alpha/beta hydrolase family protein [Gemmatimonadales bacterium]